MRSPGPRIKFGTGWGEDAYKKWTQTPGESETWTSLSGSAICSMATFGLLMLLLGAAGTGLDVPLGSARAQIVQGLAATSFRARNTRTFHHKV